jgi:hypothetical protein
MYRITRHPSQTIVISKAERPDVDQFVTLYVN